MDTMLVKFNDYDRLREILIKIEQASKDKDSTVFRFLTWADVEFIKSYLELTK